MSEGWVALAVLLIGAAFLCWWMSGFSARSRKTYRVYIDQVRKQEAKENQRDAFYLRSVELSEEGNRLRTEENALLRELIAALRERK
jgi:hypothetical protein